MFIDFLLKKDSDIVTPVKISNWSITKIHISGKSAE
jgi:hypothetical protein